MPAAWRSRVVRLRFRRWSGRITSSFARMASGCRTIRGAHGRISFVNGSCFASAGRARSTREPQSRRDRMTVPGVRPRSRPYAIRPCISPASRRWRLPGALPAPKRRPGLSFMHVRSFPSMCTWFCHGRRMLPSASLRGVRRWRPMSFNRRGFIRWPIRRRQAGERHPRGAAGSGRCFSIVTGQSNGRLRMLSTIPSRKASRVSGGGSWIGRGRESDGAATERSSVAKRIGGCRCLVGFSGSGRYCDGLGSVRDGWRAHIGRGGHRCRGNEATLDVAITGLAGQLRCRVVPRRDAAACREVGERLASSGYSMKRMSPKLGSGGRARLVQVGV